MAKSLLAMLALVVLGLLAAGLVLGAVVPITGSAVDRGTAWLIAVGCVAGVLLVGGLMLRRSRVPRE
jgi:hypothetical protein